jgi:hypothetical protein
MITARRNKRSRHRFSFTEHGPAHPAAQRSITSDSAPAFFSSARSTALEGDLTDFRPEVQPLGSFLRAHARGVLALFFRGRLRGNCRPGAKSRPGLRFFEVAEACAGASVVPNPSPLGLFFQGRDRAMEGCAGLPPPPPEPLASRAGPSLAQHHQLITDRDRESPPFTRFINSFRPWGTSEALMKTLRRDSAPSP